VRLWTINLDWDTERLSEQAHRLQTFLVVRATAAHVDADLMVDQGGLVFLEGADDALESRCDIGEVGNSTTDYQNLALGMRLAASD